MALCGLLPALGMATAAFAEHDRGERPLRSEQPLDKSLRFDVSKRSAADPIGDAAGPDITALVAEGDAEHLHVTLTFSGPVSAPGSGQPNEVNGFIDIDADQNGNTGRVPWIDFLSGGSSSGMGNEYYVDLFTFDGSEVEVVDETTQAVAGMAAMTVDASIVSIRIPLEVIGNDGLVNVAAVTTDADDEPVDYVPEQGSVASDSTSILLNGRFLVSIDWRGAGTQTRPAFVSDFRTADSANFYFLDPANLEFLIKVLDGCGSTGHYWVFFAGATDVEFTVTATDTLNGQQRTYHNPLGSPANAVTDTTAFATCP